MASLEADAALGTPIMNSIIPAPLRDFGFYSEADGVARTAAAIDYILNQLAEKNRWCVEFGAWDGLVGSTTRSLILEHNFSAVLIEGSRERFVDLAKNYAAIPRVFPRNQFVGFTATDGLDTILAGTPIPADFDFLTVDIDGNDYHAWQAVVKYRPKVVMIEFNPTIPPEVNFIQPADPTLNQGNSLTALVELGKTKGYELIAVLGVNAFFVTAELYSRFGLTDNRVTTLWAHRDCVTYFFTGYDGHVFLRGCRRLVWQEGTSFQEAQLQVLPKFLQRYPWSRNHRRWQETLSQPGASLKKFLRQLLGK
jgi:hypothetical protein